jgi:hypothetical protein
LWNIHELVCLISSPRDLKPIDVELVKMALCSETVSITRDFQEMKIAFKANDQSVLASYSTALDAPQLVVMARETISTLSTDKLDKQVGPSSATFPFATPAMADKRKAPMAGSDSQPKRPRISRDDDSDSGSALAPSERPRNNPIFGQKSAFPGLDDGGDELTYDEPDSALEYLRMVR